jgi:protein phosphatase
MALALRIGTCTLRGNVRETNQDAIAVQQNAEMALCLVADGMGGQAGGEVASKLAIDILGREFQKSIQASLGADDVKKIMRRAMVQANREILGAAAQNRNLRNMGTTIVATVWQLGAGSLFVTGLGDSRIYLLRGKKIEQLTVDHSIAQALVEAKTISAAEARVHPYKHHLWKHLGSNEVGDGPEVKAVPIQNGDRFLLCSDGLSNVVPDEQLHSFSKTHPEVQACAEGLGQLALNQGSRDNVSCIVIEVVEQK